MKQKCIVCNETMIEIYRLGTISILECDCKLYRIHMVADEMTRDFLETDNKYFVIRRHFHYKVTDVVKVTSEVTPTSEFNNLKFSDLYKLDKIITSDQMISLRNHFNKLSIML